MKQRSSQGHCRGGGEKHMPAAHHEDAIRPALHPGRESSHWHVQEGISGLL